MALNKIVQFYGFGSYFEHRNVPANDIDLLIIHADLTAESIEYALLCKRRLMAVLPIAHVTILSQEEERELEFMRKCRAIPLGVVASGNAQSGIDELQQLIRSFADARFGTTEFGCQAIPRATAT